MCGDRSASTSIASTGVTRVRGAVVSCCGRGGWASLALGCLALAACATGPATRSSQTLSAELYDVVELVLRGPAAGPAESPARDIELWASIRHESGAPEYKVHGFWDGDGQGGSAGDVYKIRFTPTKAGRWAVARVHSNAPALAGQQQGTVIEARAGRYHGFWEVDDESPGRRWFRRSDGSHQYVFGNTHYSFLSERSPFEAANGSSIGRDIEGNARYVKKVRFSAIGDLYPHPQEAPFLDPAGKPTHDGRYSHRPNPRWFHQRLDLAVDAAHRQDLIADIIMSGVDTELARAALRAEGNGGDATPFLRYLAARYGAYPNVWLCLINEYDIRKPRFDPDEIKAFGRSLRAQLAYPVPVTVHRNSGPWRPELNSSPAWNTHVNIQRKLRTLTEAADWIDRAHRDGGGDKPVIDDELSYQGEGDRHSREDTVEAHLGAFLGGGYGTTGHKTADTRKMRSEDVSKLVPSHVVVSVGEDGLKKGLKLGQYFAGAFDAHTHDALEHLQWLRTVIDGQITFWKMAPLANVPGTFGNADAGFRALAWADHEYVLGTNKAQAGITVALPEGRWRITRHDVLAMISTTLAENVTGSFSFESPASRAVLFHFKRLP